MPTAPHKPSWISGLLVLAMTAGTGGCSAGAGGTPAGFFARMMRLIPGGSGGVEGGSIWDAIQHTILLPAIGFWVFAASVGGVLAVLTPMGPKLLLAGLAGFTVTLVAIAIVWLVAWLAWILIPCAIGGVVWFVAAGKHRVLYVAFMQRYAKTGDEDHDERVRLADMAAQDLGIQVVANGGDEVQFGTGKLTKRVKLKRKGSPNATG